mgnify:CR=1 FL=1
MLKQIILGLIIISFISCKSGYDYPQEVCPGGCEANFTINNTLPNQDGYYHISSLGSYFTVKGTLSKLDPYYIINKVPLIETNFDSDYWVLFDSIQYQTPMYSYLGWYSNNQFTTPINIGTYTYTLQSIANIQPPLNIAGYQINPHICWDCSYTETLFGTHSKYTYFPQQNFFLDNEMAGDTANIFIQVLFNSDIGPSETKNTQLKVIFE